MLAVFWHAMVLHEVELLASCLMSRVYVGEKSGDDRVRTRYTSDVLGIRAEWLRYAFV